jgi:endonuclease/exonuclease/phosphatase (EEP) superfamily protein YafD
MAVRDNSQSSIWYEWVQRCSLMCSAAAILFGYLVMFSVATSHIHPTLDLASHTSWHLFLGLSIVGCFIFIGCIASNSSWRSRWKDRLGMWLIPWAYFLVVTQPWTIIPLAANDSSAKGLKIYCWNLWVGNGDLQGVVSHLEEQDADIVILIEMGQHHTEIIDKLSKTYMHIEWIPDGAAGIGVLSRIPHTQFTVLDLANEGMPAIDVDVPSTDSSQAMRILALHTRSPSFHPIRTRQRDNQLSAVTRWVQSTNQPSLVVGDLNISPWSSPFRSLTAQGGLLDSRSYRGYFSSWPSPLRMLGIPIDHLLATREIIIRYRGVDHVFGPSDHRAISAIVQ